jgi:hypothetical protein
MGLTSWFGCCGRRKLRANRSGPQILADSRYDSATNAGPDRTKLAGRADRFRRQGGGHEISKAALKTVCSSG